MDKTIIVALIALASAVCVKLLDVLFSRLAHKTERAESKEDTQTEWQKSVDNKLATDKARLDTLTIEVSEQKKMDKMLLRGTMLITQHLVDNNHTDKLKEYTHEVDEFLIDRS